MRYDQKKVPFQVSKVIVNYVSFNEIPGSIAGPCTGHFETQNQNINSAQKEQVIKIVVIQMEDVA